MSARELLLSCVGCRWLPEWLGRGLPPTVSRPLTAWGLRPRPGARR